MGQKIHPTGFRLAVARNWSSRWYAGNTNFAGMLNEDLKARAYLKKKLKNAPSVRSLSNVRPKTHALPFTARVQVSLSVKKVRILKY